MAGRDSLLRVGRAAETSGLASIWVSDHVAFPKHAESRYPYSKDGEFPVPYTTPFLEMITVLALLAGATDHVQLGTSVLILPLRNTLLVAKQIGTLAFVAPGRLIFGVGVGWLREEFEILESDFEHRGQILDEQIPALRGLLCEKDFSFEGKAIRFPQVLMEPRPAEPPPIWVGGTAHRALERAGRCGDAWHAIGVRDPADLAAKMEQVRKSAGDAGRDPDALDFTARIGAIAKPDFMHRLVPRLKDLAAAGVSHVVIDPVYKSIEEGESFCYALGEISAEFRAPAGGT